MSISTRLPQEPIDSRLTSDPRQQKDSQSLQKTEEIYAPLLRQDGEKEEGQRERRRGRRQRQGGQREKEEREKQWQESQLVKRVGISYRPCSMDGFFHVWG